MKLAHVVLPLVGLSLALAPVTGRAQDSKAQSDRVVVMIRGQASQLADSVEVEMVVAATAGEAAAAEKNYKEKLQQVLAALRGESTSKKKKADRPTAPKAEVKPAKKQKKAEDEDGGDDEEPAPKKKPADEEKKKDDGEKKEPKGDEDREDPSLKIAVELREEGFTLGSKEEPQENQQAMIRRMMMQGGQEPKVEPSFRVSSRVIAKISNLGSLDKSLLRRRLAWVVDKAVEQGVADDGSPQPRVRFILEDPEGLRKKAYEDAMKKARARAADLAKLGDRAVKGVVGVRDAAAPATQSDGASNPQVAFAAAMFGGAATAAPSPSSIDLKLEVDLVVEFELK